MTLRCTFFAILKQAIKYQRDSCLSRVRRERIDKGAYCGSSSFRSLSPGSKSIRVYLYAVNPSSPGLRYNQPTLRIDNYSAFLWDVSVKLMDDITVRICRP